MYADRRNRAGRRGVISNIIRGEYPCRLCRNSQVQNLSSDTASFYSCCYRSVQQVRQRGSYGKRTFGTQGDCAGLVAGSVIKHGDDFLAVRIIAAGERINVIFSPHFTLRSRLETSIFFTQFGQALNIFKGNPILIKAGHHFTIFLVCNACPFGGDTTAIAVLLGAVIDIRNTANSENEGQRKTQLLVVVISQAEESIAIVVVDEGHEVIDIVVFAILIKDALHRGKTCIMCKYFSSLEEKRKVQNTPFVIREITNVIDITYKDFAKRRNTQIIFKFLNEILGKRTGCINANAVCTSILYPCFVGIFYGLSCIWIILVQVIQAAKVIVQNLIFIAPVSNIAEMMIPIRVIEWRCGLIAIRVIGAATTIKVIRSVVRNDIENDLEPLFMSSRDQID